MKSTAAAIATLFALLATAPATAAENTLGRLFNTPQRRAMLDGMRERNLQISPEQQSDELRLDGIVRRSDGHSTVWLNGQAHHDRAPVLDLENTAASVPSGKDQTTRLRVGETLQFKSSTEPRP